MSGVICDDGVQWERCNGCGGWSKLDELYYERPNQKHPDGRDLCPRCAINLYRIDVYNGG